MYTLRNANEFNELIDDNEIILFEFGTNLCSPCQSIKMKIKDYEVNYDTVKFVYVPTEKFTKLAASLSIFTVPVILVYVKVKLTIKKAGFFSLESIFLQLEKYVMMSQSFDAVD